VINWFSYNGRDSREFPIYITSKNSFDKPERDISIVEVPGRNGDIIIDNGKFKNLKIDYGLKFFAESFTGWDNYDFVSSYNKISEWLKPAAEYYNLTDSYDPNYYRKACLKSSIKLKQLHYDVGAFNVSFSCKPYRYRFDGEDVIELTGSAIINNPESEFSLPLIRVTPTSSGDVTFKIATQNGFLTFLIMNVDGYVDIDSEAMNVYKGSSNYNNNYVQSVFPKLTPGENLIEFTSNVQSISIKPRWRAL
jgi:phage-related protein